MRPSLWLLLLPLLASTPGALCRRDPRDGGPTFQGPATYSYVAWEQDAHGTRGSGALVLEVNADMDVRLCFKDHVRTDGGEIEGSLDTAWTYEGQVADLSPRPRQMTHGAVRGPVHRRMKKFHHAAKGCLVLPQPDPLFECVLAHHYVVDIRTKSYDPPIQYSKLTIHRPGKETTSTIAFFQPTRVPVPLKQTKLHAHLRLDSYILAIWTVSDQPIPTTLSDKLGHVPTAPTDRMVCLHHAGSDNRPSDETVVYWSLGPRTDPNHRPEPYAHANPEQSFLQHVSRGCSKVGFDGDNPLSRGCEDGKKLQNMVVWVATGPGKGRFYDLDGKQFTKDH